MIQFVQKASVWQVLRDGKVVLSIDVPEGCTDSFQMINDQAFYWNRKTDTPVDNMKLTLRVHYKPRYFLVPAVNYNGNGWGSGAQYSGYDCDGEHWKYAWHRVAIPACTYTESEEDAVALFGKEEGGMSCSIYPDGEDMVQELIWPEVEGPKTLSKRFWEPGFQGTMEPTDSFTGIVMLMDAGAPRQRVHDLLDFAWEYFYREVEMYHSPERVKQLDLLYFRRLWFKMYNGMIGFCSGLMWKDEFGGWIPTRSRFEIGWVGQNGLKACALLEQYLEDGDEDLRDKALSALDSWTENSLLPNGLMLVRLMEKPKELQSYANGDIPIDLDACNLGWGATTFFRAAALCEKAGIDRPAYKQHAFAMCDFFLGAQQKSGEFAKRYFMDGGIDIPHGSIGAFIVLPMMDAYEVSGDKKYLDSALRALDFYLAEFNKGGCTTAGALDSNCIDKESGAPILRAAVRAYEITKEKKYLEAAEQVAYYLASWQWHYTVHYPENTPLAKYKVDTYGSTAVSAAHNALDHYGIYWVPEYIKLAELTGKDIWRQRARALWYNGIQLLSDGTLVIENRVRPAGAQDESWRHTRWGKADHKHFCLPQWCSAWQGNFRHEVLMALDNWDILR